MLGRPIGPVQLPALSCLQARRPLLSWAGSCLDPIPHRLETVADAGRQTGSLFWQAVRASVDSVQSEVPPGSPYGFVDHSLAIPSRHGDSFHSALTLGGAYLFECLGILLRDEPGRWQPATASWGRPTRIRLWDILWNIVDLASYKSFNFSELQN